MFEYKFELEEEILNCGSCLLCYDQMQCIITGTGFWDKDDGFESEKERLSDCPLELIKKG